MRPYRESFCFVDNRMTYRFDVTDAIRDEYCRDARSERPLSNQLDTVTFNGDGRTDRASLQGDVTSAVTLGHDGRTDRASTHRAT